jgi:hypothetical protein
MILSMTSGSAVLVGTALAVVLPALSFSRELETRSIQATVTKPVPRWVIYAGKLSGIAAALGLVLAALGCGSLFAGLMAVRSEAQRAAEAGGNPDHVWLTAYYSRVDLRPELKRGPDGRLPRAEVIHTGRRFSRSIPVPAGEARQGWLVLRVYAGPANPMLQSAPAKLTCGEQEYRINVDRSVPRDVVVPASAVRGGALEVDLEPVRDREGHDRGLRNDPRGTLVLAARGDSLAGTIAKTLGMIWLQLMVLAAITLTAATAMSFGVSVVAGVAAAMAGHMSGLVVGILRGALAAGKRVAAAGHGGGGHDAVEVSPLAQLVRQEASGLLGLLPDFGAASTSDFVAAGDYVPWSFVLAGVLSLLVLRVLPLAALGCVLFARREAGS